MNNSYRTVRMLETLRIIDVQSRGTSLESVARLSLGGRTSAGPSQGTFPPSQALSAFSRYFLKFPFI